MTQTQNQTTALATATIGKMDSLVPRTLEEAMEVSAVLSTSAIVPKAYRGKKADILCAIMMGSDLGLRPMQALRYISVINGMPSVYGDGLPALIASKPDFEYIEEEFDDTTMTATCRVKRKGARKETVRTFSKADAIRAGLWDERPKVQRTGDNGQKYEANNDSPWYKYPKRMLQMRARSWAIRDTFAHHLAGLYVAEEAMDIPVEREINPVPTPPETSKPLSRTESTKEKLAQAVKVEPEPQAPTTEPDEGENADPQPEDTEALDDVLESIGKASTLEELEAVTEDASKLKGAQKDAAGQAYKKRKKELKA